MKFYKEKIKILRKQNNLKTINFCKHMNISRTTLWQWESGKRIPSKENIYHIASILNISVSDISDLAPQKIISEMDLHPSALSLKKITGNDKVFRQQRIKHIQNEISALEEDIERSAIIIKGLLDSLDAMFYIKDPELKYIIANKAFLKTLSLNINYNIIGKSDIDFFNKKEAAYNTRQDKNVLRSGTIIHNQESFIPGTRKHRVGLISKLPIEDSKGAIIGLVGLFVDITEGQKNRQLLRILEYNIDKLKDAVIISNKNEHLYLNKAVESIFEYPLSKFKNVSPNFIHQHCFHNDDSQKEIEYWEKQSSPEKDISRVITPNGDIKWVEITRSRNEYLGKLCNISVIRDITHSIQLKNAKDLFINAINKSEDAFILVSYYPKEIKYFYSDGIGKLTGISIEKFFTDKNTRLKNFVHPEDKKKFFSTLMIKEVVERDQPLPKSAKFRIISSNKKIKWVEGRFFYIKEKNIFHIGAIYRDITYLLHETGNNDGIIEKTEKQTKLEIAKKMRCENISDKMIFKITGINISESPD